MDDVVVADETDTLAELAAGAAGAAGEEDAGNAHADGGVDGGSGVEGIDGEEEPVERGEVEVELRRQAGVRVRDEKLGERGEGVLLVGGVREGVPRPRLGGGAEHRLSLGDGVVAALRGHGDHLAQRARLHARVRGGEFARAGNRFERAREGPTKGTDGHVRRPAERRVRHRCHLPNHLEARHPQGSRPRASGTDPLAACPARARPPVKQDRC